MAPKATAQQGNATKARGGVSVDQNERLQQAVLGYLASGGFKRAAKAFEAESGTKKGIEHALVSAWASQAVGTLAGDPASTQNLSSLTSADRDEDEDGSIERVASIITRATGFLDLEAEVSSDEAVSSDKEETEDEDDIEDAKDEVEDRGEVNESDSSSDSSSGIKSGPNPGALTKALLNIGRKRKAPSPSHTTTKSKPVNIASVDTVSPARLPLPEAPAREVKRLPNKRFERIKSDAIFHHEGLRDNSYEARMQSGASANDYGARASRDLGVTKGAGFRKEKNKKKRGSYAGGEITMQSHSIKFDD
ncbi:MAG: hypothetical protein TREMPRED_001420 [Tremellales sp. Tagirdzhanova-0007]|nr:MAG: hypothetical protein TREMPRED_001420 [Tremellales sp. Tagirdzhanova-0007]